MEDADREHIIKSIPELILATKYSELINACEQTQLLSNVMRSRIDLLPDADENKKHKELFIKLTKRGPDAFEKLIQVLVNLDFSNAVHILRAPKHNDSPYISMHNRTTQNPEPLRYNTRSYLPEGCYPSKDNVDSKETLVPFTEKIKIKLSLKVKKSKAIHYDREVPCYPMKSEKRGVLFMVNIIDFPKCSKEKRSGAELDGQHLLYLFQELGFTCFPYDNLTSEEFFDILRRLRSSEYMAQTESFVMVLMSHGEMTEDMHDRVEFHDGSVVKVKDIEDFLSNEVCKNLVNKPKVLIFPFCRGQAPDKGIRHLQTDGIPYRQRRYPINVPTRSDMLVCYATVRGFEALRDPGKGSWYIQTLCEVLAEYAHNTHLEDMLKIVGNKLKVLRSPEGHLQTPAFYNHGFNKQLYFNPGVFEDLNEKKFSNTSVVPIIKINKLT